MAYNDFVQKYQIFVIWGDFLEQSILETRFKRNGVEMPFHCLTLHVKQHKAGKEGLGIHYHEYIEILYSLESDAAVYINGFSSC